MTAVLNKQSEQYADQWTCKNKGAGLSKEGFDILLYVWSSIFMLC